MYFWQKNVVSELFDDEFIIANLDNGLYYSVQGNIVNVLNRLPFESLELILTELAIAPEAVEPVWQQLQEEALLTAKYIGEQTVPDEVDVVETQSPNKLSKYADMKDLLALDPIHDVDEQGWPEVDSNDTVKSS